MSAPYLTVANLTRLIEDRDCFPEVITDDELDKMIDAAERLVGRARQELVNRLTAQLWAEQKPAKP